MNENGGDKGASNTIACLNNIYNHWLINIHGLILLNIGWDQNKINL